MFFCIIHVVTKGQGVNMLKIGVKRRRTRTQIEEEERLEFEERERQQSALAELDHLRSRFREVEA